MAPSGVVLNCARPAASDQVTVANLISQYSVSCMSNLLGVCVLTSWSRLSASTGMPSACPMYSLATRPTNVGGAIEASGLFKQGGYYYLFTSWDRCCAGTDSTYNIRVGRATKCDRLLCGSGLLTYATFIFFHNCAIYQSNGSVSGSVWCRIDQRWR